MSFSQALLLILAAALGGTLNSVVGGGSFVVFPAMMFAGVAPLSANATTALVLVPAAIASTVAYRGDLVRLERRVLVTFSAISLVGGVAGALLLLRTSDATFVRLVPWLLLFGTVLFSAGGWLRARLPRRETASLSTAALCVGALVQGAIAIYGGYFGGGMGIMMLATYSLLGMTDIHAMNGLRTLTGTLLNAVAVVAFMLAHKITWQAALWATLAATTAGYVGAAVARRLDPVWVRRFVMGVAWAMTAYFFFRAYA